MSTAAKSRKKSKPAPHFFETLEERAFSGRYVALASKFKFMDTPHHPLIVPSGWARVLEGEFQVAECDFSDRKRVFAWAQNLNRMEMDNHSPSCDEPAEFYWHVVFEVGEIEDGSWVSLECGCAAEMHIRTTFILAQPTAEEIREAEATVAKAA